MLNKYYTPVTIVLAIAAFLYGNRSFDAVLGQVVSIIAVINREKAKEILSVNLKYSLNGFIIQGLVFLLSLPLGAAPMIPYWESENNSVMEPLFFAVASVYWVLVVWQVNKWASGAFVEKTYNEHYKELLEEELRKFPNARGWATPSEIAQRFNLPMGDYTAENMTGVYIGNAIHWNELGHILTVGGAGQGKGTCLVLPALLSDGLVRAGVSVVCLDPKGENAAVAAPHLKRAGYDVHIINPFGIKEVKHLGNSRWNPFNLIEEGDDKKFCDTLAFALHNRKSGGDGEFFNSRCRQYISLYMRYVLHHNRMNGQSDIPLLNQFFMLVRLSGERREILLSKMATDENFSGSQQAEAILSRVTSSSVKTEDSIFSTIEDATAILEDQRLMDSLSASDFDMREISKKPTAIFICVRHDELRYYSTWLRLFTDMLLKTLNAYYNPSRKVLVLLDEFAQLGYVDQFAHAPAVLRGYNITLWPIVQHIGQLQDLYGKEGFETFIGNSVIKHWFGGNGGTVDNATAEYVIKRLPKKVEITNDSKGRPYGREVPVLDMQGFINYPKIIGEASKLPAAFEIEKIPYWNLGFSGPNASPNPFYDR